MPVPATRGLMEQCVIKVATKIEKTMGNGVYSGLDGSSYNGEFKD